MNIKARKFVPLLKLFGWLTVHVFAVFAVKVAVAVEDHGRVRRGEGCGRTRLRGA